jgi:hypothetical protein
VVGTRGRVGFDIPEMVAGENCVTINIHSFKARNGENLEEKNSVPAVTLPGLSQTLIAADEIIVDLLHSSSIIELFHVNDKEW